MCGIFGIVTNEDARFTARQYGNALNALFKLSESRGKEASGLAVLNPDAIDVLKSPVVASLMIRMPEYNAVLTRALANGASHAMIGHSRLVTTGSQNLHNNNQPVIADGIVGVHNGIIVNQDDLWARFPQVKREYEVDTEAIMRLIRHFYTESGSLPDAVRRAFREIRGATSIAVFFAELDVLLLATNNGSLYSCANKDRNTFMFASERYIMRTLTERRDVREPLGACDIRHIPAGQACLVNTRDASFATFQLSDAAPCTFALPLAPARRAIHDLDEPVVKRGGPALNVGAGLVRELDDDTKRRLERLRERYPYDTSAADSLRRCTRCILPETMPFIEFDAQGVCNFCRNYQKIPQRERDELLALADRHRRTDGEPDCVVGVSGGRDSLYGIHYIKNILKLNPVAYTYDWGMVTDIARRNAARVLGKLGIEHILVSADIAKKRRFIRANVAAWLKRPALGTIPLFMAGDKQYFYYLQQVKRQVGVDLTFLCENMLERTDFKTGYAGVKPFNKDRFHVYSLPLASKVAIGAYYAKEYLLNPAYINASLADTLFAYACFYLIDRGYSNLYTYVPWIEEEVVGTLINDYDFELSTDTRCTWRIGDGTAAFYNYIYYAVSGFSEHDTFRSNQIREGYIERADALRRVREENAPRYETVDWYLRIINLGMDTEEVFAIINRMPKRYTR